MPGLASGVVFGGGAGAGVALGRYDAPTKTVTGRAPAGSTAQIKVDGVTAGTATAGADGVYSYTFGTAPAAGSVITASVQLPSAASGEIRVPVPPVRIRTAGLYMTRGTRRHVDDYSGPIIDVAANGSTVPIGLSGEEIDKAWVADLQGGAASMAVMRLYDQSGNARHASTLVPPKVSAKLSYKGALPIIFDSLPTNQATSQHLKTTGLSFERRDHTYFLVLNPTIGWRQRNHWFNMLIAGDAIRSGIGTNVATSGNFQIQKGPTLRDGTNILFPNKPLRTMPLVMAIRSNASGRTFWWGDQTHTAAALAAATLTTHELGWYTTFALALLNSRYHLLGDALYSTGALTDAEVLDIKGKLETIYGVPTAFGRRLILAGDSNQEGLATALYENLCNTLQLRGLLTHPWEMFNVGVSGRRIAALANATGGTDATSAAYEYSDLFRAGQNDISVNNAGVNDLGDTTGEAVYNFAQACYNNAVAAGGKQIFCTVPPRGDWAQGGTPDNNRLDYNARLRANPPGGMPIIDIANDPLLGTYDAPKGPLYRGDQLHYTAEGFQRLATGPGLYADTLNALAA